MPRRGHVISALAQPGFTRLFAVRLAGQFGDGVFQASLAGAVLFSPDKQAHASDVAAGFAVLLLPYSFIGPFAGVLLDRWWRQRVLVLANLFRAFAVLVVAAEIATGFEGIVFYATALVVISLSRFFNSALSVSLPHVVLPDDLVTANALTTTVGSVATTVGGAAALGVRALIGSSNHAYAVLALAAVVPYVVSALSAQGFERRVLGPDETERRARESVADVARGLVAGAGHIRERRPALFALAAIGVHRLCFGLWTVMTLLLYRNYFHSDGVFRAGLAGLTQVVALVAVGGGLAALLTPNLARRLGYARWPAQLLLASGVVVVVTSLPYALPIALTGALLLGFASQGIKICVDTIVQTYAEDEYRGRVFTLYDAVFNVALVFAAVLTALVMPEDGHAPVMVVAIGVVYVACAAAYQLLATRAGTAVSPPARSTSA